LRLAGVHAGAAGEGRGDDVRPAAEDVPEDAGTGRRRLPASEEAGDVVQHAAVVVTLQGRGEGARALGPLGVAGQAADEQREGGADERAGGVGRESRLVADPVNGL